MKKIIIVSFHWVEKYEYTTYTYLVTEKKNRRIDHIGEGKQCQDLDGSLTFLNISYLTDLFWKFFDILGNHRTNLDLTKQNRQTC